MDKFFKILYLHCTIGISLLLAAASCKSTALRMQTSGSQKESSDAKASVAMSMNVETSASGSKSPRPTEQSMPLPERQKHTYNSAVEGDVKTNASQPANSSLQGVPQRYMSDNDATGTIISYLDTPKSLCAELKKAQDIKTCQEILERSAVLPQQGLSYSAAELLGQVAPFFLLKVLELTNDQRGEFTDPVRKQISALVRNTINHLTELVKSDSLTLQDITESFPDFSNISKEKLSSYEGYNSEKYLALIISVMTEMLSENCPDNQALIVLLVSQYFKFCRDGMEELGAFHSLSDNTCGSGDKEVSLALVEEMTKVCKNYPNANQLVETALSIIVEEIVDTTMFQLNGIFEERHIEAGIFEEIMAGRDPLYFAKIGKALKAFYAFVKEKRPDLIKKIHEQERKCILLLQYAEAPGFYNGQAREQLRNTGQSPKYLIK